MKNRILSWIGCFCGALLLVACKSETRVAEKIVLSDAWKLQSSGKVAQSGAELSTAAAETKEWYAASVPTTVMGALIENGLYPDVMVGENMKSVDKTPFDRSWWFVKEFDLKGLEEGRQVSLNFDGVTYRANVWLNGEQIATAEELYGPFRRFSYDITAQAKEKNYLAVEVFRAQDGEPNIGFVDWNPRPADENMGIFREVIVETTGKASIRNTRVISRVNTESLAEAWLTIETEVTNHSTEVVKAQLRGSIEDRNFTAVVNLEPGERKIVRISPSDVEALHIENPRLWWCNNMGNPEMYELNLELKVDQTISDSEILSFGIRELEDYFTDEGHRGFKLNGRDVLVKSAGWTDNMFLMDTPESNEIQVRYVKDMNLNSIRFENIWGTSRNIYDLCDRYGLLALVGWSCHWEWESYMGSPNDEYGCIISEHDMDLIAESFRDQIIWLRNHPSIIAWFAGSDMLPRPALEKRYMDILGLIDNRPYVGAASTRKSEITGLTGMKMNGPYEYVGPNYWYEDTQNGGAYGFNTETGIGAQLPVLESIQRFIPADKLWPINDEWSFHCTTSTTAMNTLSVLTEVMNKKYGQAKDLNDYVQKAHVIDYEGTRAMFEAFRANKYKATGIVQWMLNSAWPSLYWQLYDYYLIPTAGYYSVKKANEPQQLIYNYAKHSICMVNEADKPFKGKALIEMYGLDSEEIMKTETAEMNVAAGAYQDFMTPGQQGKNTFLSLKLFDEDGTQVADNFYWLSANDDVHDYAKTDWVHTPIKQYADQKALNNLPEAELVNEFTFAKDKGELKIKATNKDKLAFFVRYTVKDEAGEIISPVFWSDNYIGFLPGEEKTLTCSIDPSLIKNKKLYLYVSGWNVKEQKHELKN